MKTTQGRQVCVLLPNKQQLECAVRVGSRGRDVLNSVLKQLGVSQLQVFGLAALRDNEYIFIDLEQKLSKYFGKRWSRGSLMIPFILFLRVQHYVESGRLIMSSRVQQLYYAELRQKVLLSQSRHQEALFFQLAASALQAEVGDLELREGSDGEKENQEEGQEKRQAWKHRHYFLPEDYFLSWLIKRRGRDFLFQHLPELHVELRGVSRSRAVLRFIKEAVSLQDGPVTFYRMRREKTELRGSVLLGVALKGVHICQEVEGRQCLLYDFSWTDIERFTFQGRRFEISAVGSLCLPKLVYYTPSAFHSKHVLKHLSDSHHLHISTRDSVRYIQQLEDMEASQFCREVYICDTSRLQHRLQSLTSSLSDSSTALDTTTAWSKEEEEEDCVSFTDFELCVDEPEEFLVDDPDEVSWLAELLHSSPVDGRLVLPTSDWAAVTEEMKQVLRRREDEGVSVD